MTKSYYKGRESKNKVGPGRYNVSSAMGNKPFYIGQKLSPVAREGHQSPLNISKGFDRLSTCRKESSAVRLKTEYFPKTQLQLYDNKVPGPGACTYCGK